LDHELAAEVQLAGRELEQIDAGRKVGENERRTGRELVGAAEPAGRREQADEASLLELRSAVYRDAAGARVGADFECRPGLGRAGHVFEARVAKEDGPGRFEAVAA
jgi:hypothetical protein